MYQPIGHLGHEGKKNAIIAKINSLESRGLIIKLVLFFNKEDKSGTFENGYEMLFDPNVVFFLT